MPRSAGCSAAAGAQRQNQNGFVMFHFIQAAALGVYSREWSDVQDDDKIYGSD